eukprot:2259452-Amphidinium_carterae.1
MERQETLSGTLCCGQPLLNVVLVRLHQRDDGLIVFFSSPGRCCKANRGCPGPEASAPPVGGPHRTLQPPPCRLELTRTRPLCSTGALSQPW